MAKKLLENNADPHLPNTYGCSPLIWSAAKGHVEIVEALLEKKAQVNKQDNWGYTALMYAAKHDHKDVMEKVWWSPGCRHINPECYPQWQGAARQGRCERAE